MDKFVVRTSRESRSDLHKKRPEKHLKQATIESLQVDIPLHLDLVDQKKPNSGLYLQDLKFK